MSSLINQSLNIVHNQLASFSLSSGFWEAIDTAFGTAYNREVTDEVRSLWQSGDFSQLPEVEIVGSSVLGNADGSYGTTTNKIYLSSKFVTNATLSDVAKVVLEEVGHFLDAQINQKDSPGDEGAIFAELVQGNSLDSVALDLLRAESDLSKITLHGQLIDVEQSDSLSLPGVGFGSVAWADYDGDKDQDFLLTGFSDFGRIAKLYKNTGSGFEEDTSVSLPGVDDSSVAWADYDGDGDQDFLLTGFSATGRIAKLYKNTGSGFEEDTSVSLSGVYNSSVAWADYDGDKDQDFLLTGNSDDFGRIAKLYKNTGSGFEEDTSVSLPGVYNSSVAWADYDGDKDQDFLLTGNSSNTTSSAVPIAKLYKNTGSGFEEDTSLSLPGVGYSSVAWKDYDGDGDQDFLLTGDSSNNIFSFVPTTKLYKNTGSGFTETLSTPGEINDVTLTLSPRMVKEDGLENLVYTFTREGDITKELTVTYEIGGTAEESDYTGAKLGEATIKFEASNPTVKLEINPDADNFSEGNETVELTLVSGDGYTIGTSTPVIGTIEKDELPGVDDSSVAWADYDGDGDQDFLLTGDSDFGRIAKLYKNTGSGFEEDTSVSLPGVDDSSVAWADYDGNGYQDFLLTGYSSNNIFSFVPIAKLYKYNKDSKKFEEDTSVSLPGVYNSSVAWADYDGDGDQDFLLTGDSSQDFLFDEGPIAKLYKNTGSGFEEDNTVSLPGVYNSSVAWADYDGDGDQDFLLTGNSSNTTSSAVPIAKLYKNTESGFEEDTSVSLPGVAGSSVAWADYDGDGKQDFLLTGYSSNLLTGSNNIFSFSFVPTAKLYKYNKDSKKFEEDNSVSLPGVYNSSVAWADYDGDGDQDFLLTGNSSNTSSAVPIAKLYKNTESGFEEDTSVYLPGVYDSSVAWKDYDGDGDQDFLLTGNSSNTTSSAVPIAKLYKNTESGFTETLSTPREINDVTLTLSPRMVKEDGLENLVYTFTREGDITKELTVTCEIGGTADVSDYTGATRGKKTIKFEANSKTVKLEINPDADNFSEGNETVELTLVSGDGYTIGTSTPVTGTIEKDELPGVDNSSVAWADYDGDKYQDFLLTGSSIAKLYKYNKDSKQFEEDTSVSLPGVYNSSVAWADYNGDKYQDFLLTGYSFDPFDEGPIAKLYKYNKDSKKFEEDKTSFKVKLPGVESGSVAWADYDGDRDQDFLLTGLSVSGSIAKLYKNTGSGFEEDASYVSLPGVYNSSVAWANYDGDGDQDLLLTGFSVSGQITRLYENKDEKLEGSPSYKKEIKLYTEKQGDVLSKLSYRYLDYNSPDVREKLVSALNLTNAGFTNQLGLYEVDDPNTGAVEGLLPGDPGYVQAALNRRVMDFINFKAGGSGGRSVTTNGVFTQNTPTGASEPKDVEYKHYRYYAPFIIANIGTRTFDNAIEEIKDKNNSSANYQTSPVAYFSFGAANPDGANHIKYFGNNIFGFEDLPLNVSDRDFNDTVFSFG